MAAVTICSRGALQKQDPACPATLSPPSPGLGWLDQGSLGTVSVINNNKKEKHTNVRTYGGCVCVCVCIKSLRANSESPKPKCGSSHMNSLWNFLTLKWELDPGVQRLSRQLETHGRHTQGHCHTSVEARIRTMGWRWPKDKGTTKKRDGRVGKRIVKWISKLKKELF